VFERQASFFCDQQRKHSQPIIFCGIDLPALHTAVVPASVSPQGHRQRREFYIFSEAEDFNSTGSPLFKSNVTATREYDIQRFREKATLLKKRFEVERKLEDSEATSFN
jgi:hypothetical protein